MAYAPDRPVVVNRMISLQRGRVPKDPIGPAAEQELQRVGQIVANLRQWRQLGQEELAHRSGITSRHVQRVEAGDGDPAISYYVRVAFGLAVPVSWLFSDDWRHLAGLDSVPDGGGEEGGEPASSPP